MTYILLDVNKNISTLLKEMFKYNFISYNEKYSSTSKILIIDDSAENLRDKIDHFFSLETKIIVLLAENNAKDMREFLLNKKIFKCLFKTELYLLEKTLDNLINEEKIYIPLKKNGFYLSIPYGRCLLPFEEVTHITYSSLQRKSEFHDIGKNIWAIRRNISDIESEIDQINSFYKLDRGTLINLSLIKLIDFTDEKIIFKNDNFVYTSRAKLKALDEKISLVEKIYILF